MILYILYYIYILYSIMYILYSIYYVCRFLYIRYLEGNKNSKYFADDRSNYLKTVDFK